MFNNFKEKILNLSNSHVFYKTKLDELTVINKENENYIQKLENNLQKKEDEILKLEKINEDLTLLKSDNEKLNASINSLTEIEEKKYNIIESNANNINSQNQVLSAKLEEIQEDNQLTSNELTNLINQTKECNNQLKKVHEVSQSTSNDINELNKLNNELNHQTKELYEINSQLKEELLNITKNINSTHKEQTEEIHDLLKHIKYVNIKLDSKYNQLERLNESNHDLLKKISYYSTNKYLMSIIIPTYNTQEYIENCFLSILKQRIFNKIEIIFVDDSSTDQSMEKIKELKNNYDNIKIFKTEKNSGFAGKPRNIGLKHVTTDYVLFLDSDDTLVEDSCEELLKTIIKNKADIISGLRITRRKSDENKLIIDKEEYPNIFNEDNYQVTINNIKEYPVILNTYSVSSKLFSTKFLNENEITFPEYCSAEDSYFLLHAMLTSKKTIFINKDIFIQNYMRDKENKSVSFQYNQNTRLGKLRIYNMMYELSKEKEMEDICLEYLLRNKIIYFFNMNIFNKNITDKEYIQIFENSRVLLKVLLDNKNIDTSRFQELATKIINKEYDDAIKMCNTLTTLGW